MSHPDRPNLNRALFGYLAFDHWIGDMSQEGVRGYLKLEAWARQRNRDHHLNGAPIWSSLKFPGISEPAFGHLKGFPGREIDEALNKGYYSTQCRNCNRFFWIVPPEDPAVTHSRLRCCFCFAQYLYVWPEEKRAK